MQPYRSNSNREFFSLPLCKAIAAVDFVACDFDSPLGLENENYPSRYASKEIMKLLREGKKISAIVEMTKLHAIRYEVAKKEADKICDDLNLPDLESGRYLPHLLGGLAIIVILTMLFAWFS